MILFWQNALFYLKVYYRFTFSYLFYLNIDNIIYKITKFSIKVEKTLFIAFIFLNNTLTVLNKKLDFIIH